MRAKRIPVPRFSKRHVARRLHVLLGSWRVEGQFVGGEEPLNERGRVTFRWLEKDALLLMRSRMTVAPRSLAVMGADDTTNAFTILYSDERPVVRRYEMSLTSRRWTQTRREQGFQQRFIGRISENRRKIRATWEKSVDGRRWVKDFELTYTRM